MAITPDSSTLEKLRPCGRVETFSTARHHLGFYKNVALTATYTFTPASSNPTPLRPLIYASLRAVIARYSILSAIPLHEEKSYPDVYFARLPTIDLRTCVSFVQRETPPPSADEEWQQGKRDEELDALLATQHNLDFKDSLGAKPFWRLVVLYSPANPTTFTLSWVFHHALADGGSGFVFHRAFLSALQAASSTAPPSSAENEDAIVNAPSTSLNPPLESLLPLSISYSYLLKTLLSMLLPSLFAPRPAKLWTGRPCAAAAENTHPCIRTLVFSAQNTTQLLQISRREKTTLQATLECVLASALLACLPPDKYDTLNASGPISLRPLMRWDGGSLDDELVNGVSEYTFTHVRPSPSTPPSQESSRSSTFCWDEARAVRAAITAEVAKKGRNIVVGLLRYVSDMPRFFLDKVAKGAERATSFELSNVGVFKPTATAREEDSRREAARWEIGRMVFSQSPGVTGPPVGVSVVTGGDGCLLLAFNWFDGIVEGGFMEKVSTRVEEEVRWLIEGDGALGTATTEV